MSAQDEEQELNRESRTETPGLAASGLENRVASCESDIAALRNGAATQAADIDALYGLHGGNAPSVAALEKRVAASARQTDHAHAVRRRLGYEYCSGIGGNMEKCGGPCR